MMELPENTVLRPMRSVAKFVHVTPISSTKDTPYTQAVVPTRFFWEIYIELGRCQDANVWQAFCASCLAVSMLSTIRFQSPWKFTSCLAKHDGFFFSSYELLPLKVEDYCCLSTSGVEIINSGQVLCSSLASPQISYLPTVADYWEIPEHRLDALPLHANNNS